MAKNMFGYLGVIFIAMILPSINAGFLNNVMNGPLEIMCVALASDDIRKCGVDFHDELMNVDDQPFDALKTRKMCCSFNHLRDCIIDSLGDKCGEDRDSAINKGISLAVGAAKMASIEDCDTYKGNSGTVLCLNDYVLILIFIGLVVLFLFLFGATIKMCCGSGRRNRERESSQFVLLPQNGRDKRF